MPCSEWQTSPLPTSAGVGSSARLGVTRTAIMASVAKAATKAGTMRPPDRAEARPCGIIAGGKSEIWRLLSRVMTSAPSKSKPGSFLFVTTLFGSYHQQAQCDDKGQTVELAKQQRSFRSDWGIARIRFFFFFFFFAHLPDTRSHRLISAHAFVL